MFAVFFMRGQSLRCLVDVLEERACLDWHGNTCLTLLAFIVPIFVLIVCLFTVSFVSERFYSLCQMLREITYLEWAKFNFQA